MSASKQILFVVGARPNFVKTAPVMHALAKHVPAEAIGLVHTGQHYDDRMSRVFFEDLGLPEPVARLGIGSGTHAEQTAAAMLGLEPVIAKLAPRVVVVAGDVNSTLAAALVTAKAGIELAHLEAGLRSFDRGMPEELNRVVTDSLSDWLFVTEPSGCENLLREGKDPARIHHVGNTMIDTLFALRARAALTVAGRDWGVPPGERYGLVTLHRPSNVDSVEGLSALVQALREISRHVPLLFPCHPRTRQRLAEAVGLTRDGAVDRIGDLVVLEPQGYLDFIGLLEGASFVLTDSGGVQEESTALGVPCLTLRDNTERPITVELGTNTLIGTRPGAILEHVERALAQGASTAPSLPLWDGCAGERVAAILTELLAGAG